MKRQMLLLALASTCATTGCHAAEASGQPLKGTTALATPRIGLLADSQIQTPEVHSSTAIFNHKIVDRFLNVAVRTTAQNELSILGLRSLAEEIAASAELIFYLGDATNNGCEDESQAFLSTLRSTQERRPIFIVIGNHDYLGAGNTRDIDTRKSLCGEGNRPLSKLEVIERIDKFNAASFAAHKDDRLRGWSFITTIGDATTNCSDSPNQDSESRCFYSGILSSPKHVTEYLMLDTSHYEDSSSYGNFSGAIGSIGKTQVAWFLKNMAKSSDRIALSHYGIDTLNGFVSVTKNKFKMKTNIATVGSLFNPSARRRNLWLWGHTHKPFGTLATTRITGAGTPFEIETYEVGSTTDFGNYGSMVSMEDGSIETDTQPLCQLFSVKSCRRLATNLNSLEVERVRNGSAADSLGLTRAYRMSTWGAEEEAIARRNIRSLMSRYSDHGFASSDSLGRCLLRLASAQESSRDFKLEGLKGEECTQE